MRHHTTASSPAAGGPGSPDKNESNPEVISITAARAPHSDEIRDRIVKYSVTMGIRMVCIVLIFVFDGWYRLIPMIGAVVLPWFAVIIANGGSDTNNMDTSSLLNEAPMYQLEAEPHRDDDEGEPEVLDGEVLADEDESTPDDVTDDGATGPATGNDGATDQPTRNDGATDQATSETTSGSTDEERTAEERNPE